MIEDDVLDIILNIFSVGSGCVAYNCIAWEGGTDLYWIILYVILDAYSYIWVDLYRKRGSVWGEWVLKANILLSEFRLSLLYFVSFSKFKIRYEYIERLLDYGFIIESLEFN